MDAQEFMQLHADNAVAGKIQEVMKDLTPEAMTQLGPLMAGAPQPFTANKVEDAGASGDDFFFNVTYFGGDGKSVSMRETIRQVDGVWKIAALAKP